MEIQRFMPERAKSGRPIANPQPASSLRIITTGSTGGRPVALRNDVRR